MILSTTNEAGDEKRNEKSDLELSKRSIDETKGDGVLRQDLLARHKNMTENMTLSLT